VVGDYNYYFDSGGLLFGLTLENDWQIGVLVDEAHNLVERARSMNTAELVRTELDQAVGAAPTSIKRELATVAREWDDVCGSQSDDYQTYSEPPRALIGSLQRAAARMTEHAAELRDPMDAALERFYFSVLSFCRLCETFADHSLFDVSLQGRGTAASSELTIRNVIPAMFLKPRFEAARCVVLFSATLNPGTFYRNMLGLPSATLWLDVPSPFDSSQLSVRVVPSISTRLPDRAASLAPIGSLVARAFAEKPGNYIVYVSSYEYLRSLSEHFSQRFANIPIRVQRRSMNEGERADFVEQFSAQDRGVAFAILGGPFAEGIDLPGDRLIGAFIATLGMPQANAINDAIAQRLQSAFGARHEYTYLYPGLQKVTQAAGRVIRSTSDRGSLHLIDSRYAWTSVHRHLPGWWGLGNP
jgi:DNA excision repair protein ERCC-2